MQHLSYHSRKENTFLASFAEAPAEGSNPVVSRNQRIMSFNNLGEEMM